MTVLDTVAAVLEIPVAELAAEAPLLVESVQISSTATRLRLSLAGTRTAVNGPDAQRSRPVTASRIEECWNAVHQARYSDFAALFEALLEELYSATESGELTSDTHRLLAQLYQAGAAALAQLGEVATGWVAAERAVSHAWMAGDPVLAAAGEYRLVLVFLAGGWHQEAAARVSVTVETLNPLTSSGSAEATSLWGALMLAGAIVAARSNHPELAYQRLAQAREKALGLGSERSYHHTEFGPANVALHEVAVAVELGDAGLAIRTASALDMTGLSPERQSRLLIDVALAYAQLRQPGNAVEALEAAEQLAADRVHTHPKVRQMMNDLLAMSKPPSPSLIRLAGRAGISV